MTDTDTMLHELAARQAIHQALCRYMRGQDRLLPDLHRSAFHDGAFIQAGAISGDADRFVAEAQALLAGFTRTQHMSGQVDIELRGQEASGEVYFQAHHRQDGAGGATDIFIAGRYVDEYACRDGDWRITRRREVVDWIRQVPATNGPDDGGDANCWGARRAEDFSMRRDWDRLMQRA